MGNELINGVFFHPLPVIPTTGGSVMHAVKSLDADLPQFGECYFSTARGRDPKAWKKHTRMICNLFVPDEPVKFVFYDDRPDSKHQGRIAEIILSKANYGRLVIHPGIWFGFSALNRGTDALVVNLASIPHDPTESLRLEPGVADIPYQWRY